MLSGDPNDFVFLGDNELGEAPSDPGTYEFDQGKPSNGLMADSKLMNKWCARECERSTITDAGAEVVPRDMDNPQPNIPRKENSTK